MKDTSQKRDSVKEYYGKILSGNRDMKTSACCSTESLPPHHRKILREIDGEILSKFYGCGSPVPFVKVLPRPALPGRLRYKQPVYDSDSGEGHGKQMGSPINVSVLTGTLEISEKLLQPWPGCSLSHQP